MDHRQYHRYSKQLDVIPGRPIQRVYTELRGEHMPILDRQRIDNFYDAADLILQLIFKEKPRHPRDPTQPLFLNPYIVCSNMDPSVGPGYPIYELDICWENPMCPLYREDKGQNSLSNINLTLSRRPDMDFVHLTESTESFYQNYQRGPDGRRQLTLHVPETFGIMPNYDGINGDRTLCLALLREWLLIPRDDLTNLEFRAKFLLRDAAVRRYHRWENVELETLAMGLHPRVGEHSPLNHAILEVLHQMKKLKII